MEIKLTQGQVALIDDEDFELVSPYKWHAMKSPRTFYASTKIPVLNNGNIRLKMHQLILGTFGIDHINGNGCDNRRSNLRPASDAQNGANRKKQEGKVSSKYKGVSWVKIHKKWYASIKKNGRTKSLGYYEIEEDAARAYDKKAIELFGEFARPNFPIKELVS